jgi:hypothetical protein
MSTAIRLKGVISFHNPRVANPYGFISTKIPNASGAGFRVDKYFFHYSQVTQSEVDEADIQTGCIVEFSVSDRPAKPGRDPKSVNIYVFKKPVAVSKAVADALAGKSEVSS